MAFFDILAVYAWNMRARRGCTVLPRVTLDLGLLAYAEFAVISALAETIAA